MTLPLDRVQRWMQAVLMHPDGVAAGLASDAARAHVDLPAERIEEIVTRSQRLSAVERLQVYGNAYFGRLLECLQEEFAATKHAVGDEAFSAFVFGYLQQYPSRSYTLAMLGERFPQYLDETQPPPDDETQKPGFSERSADLPNAPFDRRPASSPDAADWTAFVIDLARLERIYSEVFDGPGMEREETLRSEDLLAIPADEWGDVRLVPSEGLRLEAFRFPVHEYISAIRRKEDPEVPAPTPTRLVIYRSEYIVRRLPVDAPAFALLRAIVSGATLNEAIAAAIEETGVAPEELLGNLRGWFETWTSLGFFRSVELP